MALVAAGVFIAVLGREGPARAGAAMPTGAQALQHPIRMSELTPSFTLSGPPNTTHTRIGAVSLRVWTPNPTGYRVTVQAAAPFLTPVSAGNPDVIAVSRLQVRGTGTTAFTPLSATSAVTVHSQSTMTGPMPGDAISNDFRMQIPFVRSGSYRVTVNYTAITN
jgi:hypothetical protein